ncbi:hypothetical protein T12_11082 [Trichinella patagoniensis]|uniref:Uncharacterized protein n=1 Tax=Trichinella patagoniensis TaxID=990121 RepID=A0A0V0ZYF9_9BILA|nr:hypothetical protein T12_11082 [Trichinella patagoniensis]
MNLISLTYSDEAYLGGLDTQYNVLQWLVEPAAAVLEFLSLYTPWYVRLINFLEFAANFSSISMWHSDTAQRGGEWNERMVSMLADSYRIEQSGREQKRPQVIYANFKSPGENMQIFICPEAWPEATPGAKCLKKRKIFEKMPEA